MAQAPDTLEIGPDDAGQRVDRFLRKILGRATLSLVFKLLRTGQVKVNGRKAKPDQRLVEGDVVGLWIGDRFGDLRTRRRAPKGPVGPPLVVLHRDDDVLAVDKPARLLVHEGDAGDEPTLIDAVLRAFPQRRGHTFRPALAHRLDRDTSGVVLVGLSAAGLRGLDAALRERSVRKTYLALVTGTPKPKSGVLDKPLRREEFPKGDRPKVRVGGSQAVEAVTEYRVLAAREGHALLEVHPLTGRTHQIRVHLADAGWPILGDATYGDGKRNEEARGRFGLWRQFLHAARIELQHPVTGEPLVVEAPLPDELLRVLAGLSISAPRPGGRGGRRSGRASGGAGRSRRRRPAR